MCGLEGGGGHAFLYLKFKISDVDMPQYFPAAIFSGTRRFDSPLVCITEFQKSRFSKCGRKCKTAWVFVDPAVSIQIYIFAFLKQICEQTTDHLCWKSQVAGLELGRVWRRRWELVLASRNMTDQVLGVGVGQRRARTVGVVSGLLVLQCLVWFSWPLGPPAR